jgi:polysaccharide biosynthesis/export protein
MNHSHGFRFFSSSLLVACLMSACAFGENTGTNTSETKKPDTENKTDANAIIGEMPTTSTDPAYQISKGDEVAIAVYGEGDLSTAQRIDNRGLARIPYLGDVSLAGQTVRQAESSMEKLLVEKKLLRHPMVTIVVRDYASREVSVLGAVSGPGKFRLPKESSSVEIMDVITGVGGFRPTAKSDEVKVTRTLDSGEEKVSTVDVEAMMNPRKGDRNTPRSFLVYPGDRIFVPERLW